MSRASALLDQVVGHGWGPLIGELPRRLYRAASSRRHAVMRFRCGCHRTQSPPVAHLREDPQLGRRRILRSPHHGTGRPQLARRCNQHVARRHRCGPRWASIQRVPRCQKAAVSRPGLRERHNIGDEDECGEIDDHGCMFDMQHDTRHVKGGVYLLEVASKMVRSSAALIVWPALSMATTRSSTPVGWDTQRRSREQAFMRPGCR